MSAASVDDDLFDTVAADFLARFRNGERPRIEDYTQRHPEIAGEIEELFPTMLAIENMKQQKEHSSGGQASLGARKLERLGDFRIIREIGRGGMGVVFEAEQESLERHVALKVLPPNALQDESHMRRFHREAQLAARLHHTNIVPVFGVGEDDGLHYYVMQLIDGEPLDRGLRAAQRQPLEPRRAAEIVRQIADAVQFAHEQGTLHRDIKPANILVDKQGHVWITDFGLAQVLEREDTVTDSVAGTLRYMAPERFRGIADERTDQYSLGITLYELVSGTKAFEGSSTGELMHRITHGEPKSLRAAVPQVPRDLQTVIEKAISREPSHRYPSVGEFAADLERFLEGRPIVARRVSVPERVWRWCRRNRALAASLATVASLLVVVAAMLSVGYYRSQRNAIRLQGLVDAKEAALRSESKALENERQALDRERTARESAEALTTLALDGLDRVFEEFAPSTPYTVALYSTVSTSESEDQPLLLPAQATVNPQVAATLERLLPLYRQLADQTGQDAYVRYRAASAQYRLGLIYRHLGRQDAARMSLAAARGLLEELQSEPTLPAAELRLTLAQVANDLGDLDRLSPQFYRDRRKAYEQALGLLSSIPVTELSREARLELARTHFYLGRSDGFFGGPPPGRGGPSGPGRGDRGGGPDRGPRGGRPRDEPREPRAPSDTNRPDRGASPADGPPPPPPEGPPPVQRETGRPPGGGPGSPPSEGRGREGSSGRPPFGGGFFPSREENRQHITTAIQLLEALPNADRDTRAQLLLAQCYRELSNQRDWDDPDARKADWEKAVAILQELVREAPKTPEFRFELTEVYADVDPRRLPEDRLGEAEPRLREALRLSQDLVTEAPDVPAYAAGQTQILVRLGHLLRRTNRNDEALSRYQEAIAIQTGLAARFPETPDHLVWSARVRRYSAEILQTEERYDEAIALLKQSAADVEPFVTSSSARDNPAMFFASFTLSETYGTLADILRDQGLTDEADVCRQRAREFGPQKLFRNRRPPPDSTDRN